MTSAWVVVTSPAIIPYQELLGNYDRTYQTAAGGFIIPYQELLGNYDKQAKP